MNSARKASGREIMHDSPEPPQGRAARAVAELILTRRTIELALLDVPGNIETAAIRPDPVEAVLFDIWVVDHSIRHSRLRRASANASGILAEARHEVWRTLRRDERFGKDVETSQNRWPLRSAQYDCLRFTGMPGWGGEDEENWKLVLFIRHLPKLSQEELELMKKAQGAEMEHH